MKVFGLNLSKEKAKKEAVKERLTKDEREMCEEMFEDDELTTVEIGLELGVPDHLVKYAKARWRRRVERELDSQESKRSQMMKQWIREEKEKQQLREFLSGGEGNGGDNDFTGVSNIIDSLVAAAESSAVQQVFSNFAEAARKQREVQTEQPMQEAVELTKDEMIENHITQLLPFKNDLTVDAVKQQMDHLPDEHKEAMKTMYESREDLRKLASGLEFKQILDSDLDEILEKIHGKKPEEKPEEKPGEKPKTPPEKAESGGEPETNKLL